MNTKPSEKNVTLLRDLLDDLGLLETNPPPTDDNSLGLKPYTLIAYRDHSYAPFHIVVYDLDPEAAYDQATTRLNSKPIPENYEFDGVGPFEVTFIFEGIVDPNDDDLHDHCVAHRVKALVKF